MREILVSESTSCWWVNLFIASLVMNLNLQFVYEACHARDTCGWQTELMLPTSLICLVTFIFRTRKTSEHCIRETLENVKYL